MTATEDQQTGQSTVHLPRIAIKFCTQCKWNLRAAYYAQELLQTFSTTIGEIALIPVTGGIFTVTLYHHSNESTTPTPSPLSTDFSSNDSTTTTNTTTTTTPILTPTSTTPSATTSTKPEQTKTVTEVLLWDRKAENGFPETKELKNRVRNVLEPKRDLGHIDRSLKKGSSSTVTAGGGGGGGTTTTTMGEKEKGQSENVVSPSTSTPTPTHQVAGNNQNDGNIDISDTSTGIKNSEEATIKECEDCK